MAMALIRKGLEVAPAIELASEEAEENTTLEAND
jgi:hypothetical protein